MSTTSNNNNNVLIIIVIVVIAFVGLAIYFSREAQTADYLRWSANYDDKGIKNPHDLGVFYSLLKEAYPINRFEERLLKELPKDETAKGSVYMFVGSQPKYSEAEAEHLLQYVEQGGIAFIAATTLPDSLGQFLFFREDCGFDPNDNNRNFTLYGQGVQANFTHPSLQKKRPYEFQFKDEQSNNWYQHWGYYPKHNICESATYPIAELGTIRVSITDDNTSLSDEDPNSQEQVNFFRVKVKEGYFYFHTTPIFFTNYFMIHEDTYEYTNKVLAHFNPTTLYWDKISSQYPIPEKRQVERPNTVQRNPMEYVYSQPGLRAAWYLLLGAGLLYILFRAKRKQRIIPILEPNRNTSLEFVETIGLLYFQQQSHKTIFTKLMQHFLAHLRQRYHLVTRDMDEKLIERIHVRTEVPTEIIAAIFNKYNKVSAHFKNPNIEVSAETLNEFYAQILRFYKAEEQNKFTEEKREQLSKQVNVKTLN